MEKITAYGCSYCSMTSRTKATVKRHEALYCRKNRNRTACSTCDYLIRDTEQGNYCDLEIETYAWGSNDNIKCDRHKFKED